MNGHNFIFMVAIKTSDKTTLISRLEVKMDFKCPTITVTKQDEKKWLVYDDVTPIVGKGISRESAFKCYDRGIDLLQQKHAGVNTGINDYLEYLEQNYSRSKETSSNLKPFGGNMTKIEQQILLNQEMIMEALYELIPNYNSTASKNLNHYCWLTNKLLKEERENKQK